MCARLPFAQFLGVTLLFVFFVPDIARAQLNDAYNDGYKPMLDLASDLQKLVETESRRGEHAAVKELADKYIQRLDRIIAAAGNIGVRFKDGDNDSWARAARSATFALAKEARSRAEAIRSQADNKLDCLAQVRRLQETLAQLSDEFKKCWRAHEDRLRDLTDRYNSTRQRWWDETKEDRRPIDDMSKKVEALREKRNDLQAKSDAAGKLYLNAQDQCDKARGELFRTGIDRSPDEVNRRYEEWKKAEDLVKRVAELAVNAEKDAADAARAYSERYNEWKRASDEYLKQAS